MSLLLIVFTLSLFPNSPIKNVLMYYMEDFKVCEYTETKGEQEEKKGEEDEKEIKNYYAYSSGNSPIDHLTQNLYCFSFGYWDYQIPDIVSPPPESRPAFSS